MNNEYVIFKLNADKINLTIFSNFLMAQAMAFNLPTKLFVYTADNF